MNASVGTSQVGPPPLGFWYHQKSLDKIDLLLLLLLCNSQTSQEKVIEFKVIFFSPLKINLKKNRKMIFSQRTLMLSPF
jgi:hypothetical protein